MIDRYDLFTISRDNDQDNYVYAGIEKDESGDYVKYEDMVELLTTLGYNIEDLS